MEIGQISLTCIEKLCNASKKQITLKRVQHFHFLPMACLKFLGCSVNGCDVPLNLNLNPNFVLSAKSYGTSANSKILINKTILKYTKYQ